MPGQRLTRQLWGKRDRVETARGVLGAADRMGQELALRPFPASGYSEYWTARRRKGLYFKGFTTRHGPRISSYPASSLQIQFPLRFDEFLDRKFDLFAGVGS